MKQVILVRQDLKMPKGKLAAQVSHASVAAVLKSGKAKVEAWNIHAKKVIVKVKDEKELLSFNHNAQKARLKTAVIRDAGKTFFKKPTITCLAIGPDDEEKIDKVTKNLKML